MILIAGIDILRTALFGLGATNIVKIDLKMLVLFLLSLIIMLKKDIDPIKVMLGSGLIYLLVNILAI